MKKYIFIVFCIFLTVCSKTISTQEIKYNKLYIPPILNDLDNNPNTATFKLTARKGKVKFFQGPLTITYGYNLNYLGPTIRVKKDQIVRLAVTNKLGVDTTVHWHGLIIPGKMDGGPHQVIKPRTTWKPYFRINQPAGTFWYHPHLDGRTGEHAYMGLAGMFIIDDKISQELDIPKRYAIDDIPLIVQDRLFDNTNQFEFLTSPRDIIFGMQGDVILANGTRNAFLYVITQMIRLRILNGSNARVYTFNLSDNSYFYQIASDGGFLEKRIKLNKITLSPGERAEIIIDFSKYKLGKIVNLTSDAGNVLRLVKKGNLKNVNRLPSTLTYIPKLKATFAVKRRTFDLRGMGTMVNINDEQYDPNRINFRINRGDIEVWTIGNHLGGMMRRGRGMMGRGRMMDRGRGGMMGMMLRIPHNFHIHGVQFQVLEFNDKLPPLNMMGWKDTILLNFGESAKIIVRFTQRGVFMFHCHLMEHEDRGMMGQFLVR